MRSTGYVGIFTNRHQYSNRVTLALKPDHAQNQIPSRLQELALQQHFGATTIQSRRQTRRSIVAQANFQASTAAAPALRVFKKNSQWYFHTRDAQTRGPYIEKQQAFWALAKHIRQRANYR